MSQKGTKPVDLTRHERDCKICAHPDREEIEREFSEWKPVAVIAKERHISRPSLYRHLRALNLFERRDRNIKSALANFIEKGFRVRVTASSFVAAIQAYSKINSEGAWIDKTEQVGQSHAQRLFDRMTRGEMLRYAESGELPSWWVPPEHRDAQEGELND
jgi:hypothetical protein